MSTRPSKDYPPELRERAIRMVGEVRAEYTSDWAAVCASFVGTLAVGMSSDDIINGFPSELFLTLVGVTYLFAIAQNNGTVDLTVRGALRLVRRSAPCLPPPRV